MRTTHLKAGETGVVENLALRIDTLLGRAPVLYLAIAAILSFVTWCGYSHAKVPWEDEVLQVTIARQPTAAAVWEAVKPGYIQVDPPMAHLLVHYLFRVFGEHIFLARLPSMLGYTLMCVCLAILVRRYSTTLYAAAAFFLPYLMPMRWRAMDARPYGLLYGMSALTLLSWDGIQSGRNTRLWRIGFTLSLAVALLCHFYSILIFLPLALGELARWYYNRRPDWKTWICAAIALIPWACFTPTLVSASRGFLKGYYYKPAISNVLDFYGAGMASLPFAMVLVALGAVLACEVVPRFESVSTLSERHKAMFAAIVGFLLIPVVSYIGAVFITKLFAPYYHWVAMFGLILGVPLVLSALSGRNRVAGLCLLLCIGGFALFVTARGLTGFLRHDVIYPPVADLRKVTGEANPDILVPSPFHFLPFYETDRMNAVNSLIYLYDPERCYKAAGSDTADKVHHYLRPYTTARIEQFDTYLASHKRFYIASMDAKMDMQEWQFKYFLNNDPASLTWMGKVGDFNVYRVDLEHSPLPAAPKWP